MWNFKNGGFVSKSEFFEYLRDIERLSQNDIDNMFKGFTDKEIEDYSRQYVDDSDYIVTYEYDTESINHWYILDIINNRALHNEYFLTEKNAQDYLNDFLLGV